MDELERFLARAVLTGFDFDGLFEQGNNLDIVPAQANGVNTAQETAVATQQVCRASHRACGMHELIIYRLSM